MSRICCGLLGNDLMAIKRVKTTARQPGRGTMKKIKVASRGARRGGVKRVK